MEQSFPKCCLAVFKMYRVGNEMDNDDSVNAIKKTGKKQIVIRYARRPYPPHQLLAGKQNMYLY